MSEHLTDEALVNGGVDDDFEIASAIEAADANVLGALKRARARVAEQQTYDLAVPGWRDLLVLRLGPISGTQQQRIIDRATRRSSAPSSADTDLLVAAFREVLGRATPTSELAVLVDADGDPVGLDERLANLLDLGPVHSAREVVHVLFAGANSPPAAIQAASGEWVEWARSADDEVNEGFLGE